jgi:hypothetical protein
MRRSLAVAALLLLAGAPALADEVVLKGGSRLEGVVLEKDERSLLLLLPGSTEIRLAAADVAEVRPDGEAPAGSRVIRYVERPEGGAALQVALVHLVKPGSPRIDLVGAVHIADGSYYREVQALLERAEVVLYEMVKPKDARPDDPEHESRPNPIRDLQRKFAKWFGLEFQLDGIEYDRPHFVHADLTVEEVLTGDLSDFEPAIRLANQLLGGHLEGTGPEAEERRAAAKKAFARVMGMLGSRAAVLFGPQMTEVLIHQRDAVVIERVKELPAGTKHAAVFYGAGHLPDLEQRLVAEGYRRAGARWLDAWRIPATP